MKKSILLTIAAVLCSVMTIFAQTNNKISYQAVVRDANNNLVANTPLTVQVTLTDANNNAYSERHSVTSNTNGLISLTLGNGTDVSGNWDDIQWNKATVTTKIYRFSDGEQLGTVTMPLMAVPYALYADSASLADHAMAADSVNETWLTNYLTTHNINGGGSGSFTQENADWNATSGVAEILNKPSIRDSVSRTLIDSLADENSNISQLANSFANNYLTTNHFLTKDSSVITNLQAGIQKAALCDSVSGCVGNAISTALQGYATQQYVTDYVNNHAGSSNCENCVTKAKAYADSLAFAMKIDTLNKHIDTLYWALDSLYRIVDSISKIRGYSDKFIVETDGQTNFTLTHEPLYNYLVVMYVNGVMVGDDYPMYHTSDSHPVVDFLDNTDFRKITYDPTENFGYQLKEGDKVVFHYHYSPYESVNATR